MEEETMKIKQNIAFLLLIIGTILFFAGCADKSKELLAEDYKKMTNERLLEYFYQVNDEIEKQEKSSGPSVGIGVGGFGHHSGGGIGVGTGGTGYTAEDLRARRIEIRLEMKRRNLTP
jgi:hypothetical protein